MYSRIKTTKTFLFTCNLFLQDELITCLDVVKANVNLFVKIMLMLIGSIKSYVLYYCDIGSDYFFVVTLFLNCHYIYGSISVAILCFSYCMTVLYLKFRMKQSFKKSIFYPYYHGRYFLVHIKACIIATWHGERLPENSDEAKNFAHAVEFIEIMTESVFQLCLSCIVLREYGLSLNSLESFNQLSGLFFSLLSICITFSQVSKLEFCFLIQQFLV